MNDATRRGFLKTAGVSAAAAGAVSLMPSARSAEHAATALPQGKPAAPAGLPSAAAGSMVAYIHDVSTGEIVVMVEGREVVVTDHELIAKLATALHATTSV